MNELPEVKRYVGIDFAIFDMVRTDTDDMAGLIEDLLFMYSTIRHSGVVSEVYCRVDAVLQKLVDEEQARLDAVAKTKAKADGSKNKC